MNIDELYYLQDSRQLVGNSMLWWARGEGGYVTDIGMAHVYTKSEAVERNKARFSDIPWPKGYIDNNVKTVIDTQSVKIEDGLKDTGIKLTKEKKRPVVKYNCVGCGRFASKYQSHDTFCKNCGDSN